MLSPTEENYLKALLKIASEHSEAQVGTNELAAQLEVKPATVNSMLKKLKEKGLIAYEKYGKIQLTSQGQKQSVAIIRRHRLWETFLYQKLGFTWDEVHEVAEQLEHVNSPKLTELLDQFLGYPQFDPHGEPIPGVDGRLKMRDERTLSDMEIGTVCELVAVNDDSSTFLRYAQRLSFALGDVVKIKGIEAYDDMMEIEKSGETISVSRAFAMNFKVREV